MGNSDFGADNDDGADDDGVLEPEEGHEFVYADAIADFGFPFQMEEEEDGELTVTSVADFEDAEDMQFEPALDLEVPLNELVSGVVSPPRTGMHEGSMTVGLTHANT